MKSPYDLELHETVHAAPLDITAVPGGWIYMFVPLKDIEWFEGMAASLKPGPPVAVFVPDFPEPEEKELVVNEESDSFNRALVKCLNDFLGGERPEIEANKLIRGLLRKASADDDKADAHS